MSPQVAATPPLAAAKTPKASEASQVRKITLKTGMAGGKMVYLDDKGKANPVIRGNVGDTIEITISSGEGAQHDIVFEGLNVKSTMFDAKSGPARLSFKLTQSGKFNYFCSVPGHRQIGMEGVLEVTGPADASRGGAQGAGARRRGSPAATGPKAIAPASPKAVSIAMDPNAVPAALGARAPKLVKYAHRDGGARRQARRRHHLHLLDLRQQGARPDAAGEGRRHRRAGADQRARTARRCTPSTCTR